MYRILYDSIRAYDESMIDFSLDAFVYKERVTSWFKTCFSIIIFIFHGTILATILIVTLIIKVFCA